MTMLTFTRRVDCYERLNYALTEHQKRTFKWGDFDCGTLFSDAVFGMTDVDPMKAFGRWTSETEALKCVFRLRHLSVKSYLDTILPTKPLSEAQRGDVGYTEDYGTLSCPAVIVGSEAMTRDTKGWLTFPTSKLVTVYRIG